MAKSKRSVRPKIQIHPYSDVFVQEEQALAELADSLDLYVTRDAHGYDLRRIEDLEFIDQSLDMCGLKAVLLKAVAHRLGLVPDPEMAEDRRWHVPTNEFAKVIELTKRWPAVEGEDLGPAGAQSAVEWSTVEAA